MARIDALAQQLQQASRVGLDTVVFIYAFERHPEYGPLARAIFRALEDGQCQGLVSVLALGEVLAGIKKTGNQDLLLRYRDVFRRFPGLTMYDVDLPVIEWMSDLRARHGIPTPDALHLGTALAHQARAFVTNDVRLRHLTEIEVLVLADYL